MEILASTNPELKPLVVDILQSMNERASLTNAYGDALLMSIRKNISRTETHLAVMRLLRFQAKFIALTTGRGYPVQSDAEPARNVK